jgi:hypothetical protein
VVPFNRHPLVRRDCLHRDSGMEAGEDLDVGGDMTQTALMFDRPRPGDLFKPGSQSYRIYQRLLDGPLTNREIVEGMKIYNSTGRCSDLRKALKPYLLDVKATRIHDGLFEYSIT